MATVQDKIDIIEAGPDYIPGSLRIIDYENNFILVGWLDLNGNGSADEHKKFFRIDNTSQTARFEDMTVLSEADVNTAINAVISIIDEADNYKKPSYATELKNISKGGINKITIKPRVLMENMNFDTNNIQTLGSGGITEVGQVFKLTSDITTLDRVHLTLEATAGGAVSTIDDFESYEDTTALRVVWVPSDVTNTPNELDTSVYYEGAKAMKVTPGSKQKSKGDEIVKTFGSSQDWSTYTGLQFQFRQDASYSVEIVIEDSDGNGSKQSITVSDTSVWEAIQLSFDNFIPVGAIAADLTKIDIIKFSLKTANLAPFYVDLLQLYSDEAFGDVTLEVYDFGADPTPTTIGSPIGSTTFSLESGKKIYEIPISLNGLTPNSYYGLVLTNPTTSTVKVYGKNGSDKYTSGWAFESTDGTNITSTGSGDDLFFLTFCLDNCIMNGINFVVNSDTGTGKLNVFINDNAAGKGKTSLFLGEHIMDRREVRFPIRTQTNVGVRMTSDELLYITYEDDSGSLANKIQATAFFVFVDRELNG